MSFVTKQQPHGSGDAMTRLIMERLHLELGLVAILTLLGALCLLLGITLPPKDRH
jgi:hypothetical protein